jgi:hypothetical protein
MKATDGKVESKVVPMFNKAAHHENEYGTEYQFKIKQIVAMNRCG